MNKPEFIYVNGIRWKVLEVLPNGYITDTLLGPERVFQVDGQWFSEHPIDKEICPVAFG